MHRVDITLPPLAADTLASYRRKLEARAAPRIQSASLLAKVALLLASSGLFYSLALRPEGALAIGIALTSLSASGFWLPLAIALRVPGGKAPTRDPGGMLLLVLALGWLAGAAAWVTTLMPGERVSVPLTLVAMLAMLAGWAGGALAGKRLLAACQELGRQRPVDQAGCQRLWKLCHQDRAAAGYLRAVMGQGRAPVIMEQEALLAWIRGETEHGDSAPPTATGKSGKSQRTITRAAA